MEDGEVKIGTKLDNSGVDKGLKDLNKKLGDVGQNINKSTKTTGKFTQALKNMNPATIAAGASVAGVAVAVKKTVDVLNDCAAAYRVQKNAEEALQVAAKNNPYLNDESVYNLRNFASELQSMSEIGDEVSLQVMSQLAATGRTEEEIMQIMSAAADMAAVTGNSIQNVALQLNKTYSGLAGELGEANGAIRALTKEELENGRAIELVAQQYKGAAAATADVEVQLSNAWGDFKENIGRGWQNVTQPVKQFFLDVLNDINEATAKTNSLKEKEKNKSDTLKKNGENIQSKEELEVYKEQVEVLKQQAEQIKKKYDLEVRLGNMKIKEAETQLFSNPEYIQLQKYIKEWEGKLKKAESSYKEKLNNDEIKKEKEKANQLKKIDDQATEYINANTKALQEQIKVMQLKASVAGEEIDAGEMYNAYLQSYIDLITKSNGLVTENNTAAKNRLATLRELAEAAKTATDEEKKLANAQKMQDEATALMKDIDGGKHKTIFDEYDEKNKQLEEWREKVDQYEKDNVISEQEAADAKQEIDRQYWQNKKDLAEKMTAEINGYIQQTADIVNNAANLMLETSKNNAKAEQAALEEKYRKGEISEEEYNEKVTESKKKAAKEQYKIQMFQWTASMLAATANIAEGVTKAIAKDGIFGIITGALVAAAGGVPLASIIASKPTPPNFAGGGVIGGMNGASMGADNTYIHARTGEMVVNAAQQKALWEAMNGGANGAGGANIVINNSAANIATAQPKLTRDKIEIMIDARVNDSMRRGRYDQSMSEAQEGMTGDYYGI